MFFITRDVYKRLKESGELKKYIQDTYIRCNNYPMLEEELNQLLLEMELRDLVTDINESYYYDSMGLLEEIISRMVDMISIGVTGVKWDNIPLYATAIYDIVVLRGWNGNSSLRDLLFTIDIKANTVLFIEEFDTSSMCLVAQWLDTTYKYMNRYSESDKIVFDFNRGTMISKESKLDPIEFYKRAVERISYY